MHLVLLGVIRRHPDIKWLRKETDIAQLCRITEENPECTLGKTEAKRFCFIRLVLYCQKKIANKSSIFKCSRRSELLLPVSDDKVRWVFNSFHNQIVEMGSIMLNCLNEHKGER